MTPNFFPCIMLQTTQANTVQNFKKSIMRNTFTLRNAVFLKKQIFDIDFFIFCMIQDICGTILHAKFEYRPLYKIRSYSRFILLKLNFLVTSTIRTSAFISPVFTRKIASASRMICNILCFT